jgi:hypothetical protein
MEGIVRLCSTYHECRLDPDNSRAVFVVGNAVEDTDDEHHDCQCGETGVVDPATAIANEQNPGEAGAYETDSQECDTHIKSFGARKSSDCRVSEPSFLKFSARGLR